MVSRIQKSRNEENLTRVTISIVNELKNVGIYHYNKLTYLFEYLFIKNFGMKFTGELFCKLPHGPVISDYKKYVVNQFKERLIFTDIDTFIQKRTLDDYNYSIRIMNTENGEKITIQEPMIYDFLLRVLDKYSHLSVDELEEVVYQTSAVVKFENAVKQGWRKENGGYILDLLTIKNFINSKVLARQAALKHSRKYPKIDNDQYNNLTSEWNFLESMRPQWGNGTKRAK